jgi:Xaa-Pro dipeptidase
MPTGVTSKSCHLFEVEKVQAELQAENLDGWLFYYFHENDPIALRILKLSDDHFFSRRWFYFVPAKGAPRKLVHRIEMHSLDSLPGDADVYVGWRQLEEKLKTLIAGSEKVAMQYSPRGAVPYVSKIDGGMIDLVRDTGVEIRSSQDLVQKFESVWTAEQLQSHIEAAKVLHQTVFAAFRTIHKRLKNKETVNEYEIQQFILSEFARHNMTTNSPPIVAVNAHSGSPHYQPTKDSHWEIKAGDLVLLDIWAKKKEPANAVYADITWTGFVGATVPVKYKEIFDIVAGARDQALDFVQKAISDKSKIKGWQVDDAARNYITERGYGEYFVHRTGHSIGLEVHGNGANIDNLETRDERSLIANTAFSIEPGIYLEEFGIRSEIDVYISDTEVLVAGGPSQTEIVAIDKLTD